MPNWGIQFIVSIIFLLSTACASLTRELLKDPTVTVKSVKVSKFSMKDISVDLEMMVENPNAIPLSLDQISYVLNFSGEKVTSGTFDKGIEIPANGANTIVVPLNFNFEDLGNLLVNALNKSLSKEYDLSGTVKLGILSVPYSKKGTLKLK